VIFETATDSNCALDLTRIAFGGYSILFFLQFDDNDKSWILRIRLPRPGQSLTEQEQLATKPALRKRDHYHALRSRKLQNPCSRSIRLRFIVRESSRTSLHVFPEPVLGTAAIWATMSCTLEQRRKLIDNMAGIVHELSTLTFPMIGQLRTSVTNPPRISVGELITHHGDIVGPFTTSTEYYRSCTDLLPNQLLRINCGRSATDGLHNHCRENSNAEEKSAAEWGIKAASILEEMTVVDGSAISPFPLKHPDLSFQNILVDDNFCVVAVLDWSFASTVPPEVLRLLPRTSNVKTPIHCPTQ
jgi:hypothetical protein